MGWRSVLAIVCLWGRLAVAQTESGELRIEAHDPSGAALQTAGVLASEGAQLRIAFQTGTDGRYIAHDLPYGLYRLLLTRAGLAPWSERIEIRSSLPLRVSATLQIASVSTEVEVTDASTLLDPRQTGTQYAVGARAVGEALAAQPGRALLDLVDDQPGWLFEANGVLHPRGMEYGVQFVVDGVPLTENRSPAFAPAAGTDDVGSMRVRTAGYPAEYGRKLGGVVEVATPRHDADGLHSTLDLGGGSFSTGTADAALAYGRGGQWFSIAGQGFRTDRYLDPPVLQNYTNFGTTAGLSAAYEIQWTDRDRLSFSFASDTMHHGVPNELVQQQAGQRQQGGAAEQRGQVSYQHVLSPDLLFSATAALRDTSASLASNPQSTPVIVGQSRGFTEGYLRWDLAGHHGRHDWKTGADAILRSVHESLGYAITDPTQFDPGTRQQFQFHDTRADREPSAYAQDQIRLGNWNVSAGLRFDRYHLVVDRSGWSPRLGVSRYIPSLDLLLHASYDRVFETPAVENILLASSPQLDGVSSFVERLPVEPARANFYEAGATKTFGGVLRLDANVFRRDFRNFPDDDLLLDTGVSFPIAYAGARIQGEEVALVVPRLGAFSGSLSYANQTGTGWGPITGGLFLGSDGAGELAQSGRFPVSQDQRNTAHARVRYQGTPRWWLDLDGTYGSGLPVELDDNADPSFLVAQYGARIVDRVNFERGRVRPSFSLGAGGGATLLQREKRKVELGAQVFNLTDRLNVINFAGLFSGTAVAPPRSVTARLRFAF